MLIIKNLIVILLLLLITACGSSSSGNSDSPGSPPAQGTRVLGMDIKPDPRVDPKIGYSTAYDQAVAMGVREVSVSLDWALLEPTEGNYDNTWPATIESYYPSQTGDLTLVLRPLDTIGPSLPSDLVGKAFNDPLVITAFDNFLTNLHGQLTTLNATGKLKWIHVGNEIDASLGSDVTKWAQWQAFFVAAKNKIETLWGAGIVVSSIVEFSALEDVNIRAQYLSFLPQLDSAALTYYPLNADFTMRPPATVATDFDLMTSAITTKPILLQENGYPSSMVNNSSETLQADFISAVFKAWDKHMDRISLIDFTWQYDVDEATVDQWVMDFGLSGNNEFKYYLWTLGLSNYDGTEKLALQRLRDELQARGWAQ